MNLSANPLSIPRSGRMQMSINVSVDVNVTAATARRQVNTFMASYVGNLLLADEPVITVTDRIVWRVPIYLTNPVDGRIGRVGEADVDVETGEMLLTEEQISRIKQNALHLTASSTS